MSHALYKHRFVSMLLRSAQGRCVLSCVARQRGEALGIISLRASSIQNLTPQLQVLRQPRAFQYVHRDTIQLFISTSCTGGCTCIRMDVPRLVQIAWGTYAKPAQAASQRRQSATEVDLLESSRREHHPFRISHGSGDTMCLLFLEFRRVPVTGQGADTSARMAQGPLVKIGIPLRGLVCESYGALSLAFNLRKIYHGARMGACRVARYSHSFVSMLLRSAQGRCALSCVASVLCSRRIPSQACNEVQHAILSRSRTHHAIVWALRCFSGFRVCLHLVSQASCSDIWELLRMMAGPYVEAHDGVRVHLLGEVPIHAGVRVVEADVGAVVQHVRDIVP